MGQGLRLRRWSADNWFLLLAPALLALAWAVARQTQWTGEAAGLEAALLFDACVTLPLLYAVCYARKLKPVALALRMVGIACLGIYLVGWIVPVEAQRLLPGFGWARMIGLGVLVLIELRLLVAGLRMVFGGNATAEQVADRTGAPPLLAKLMLAEARFWKTVWRFLRRR